MKQKLAEEYLHCTKCILKTKLNGKNTIKAINTYATPVLTFSFGMVKWAPTDLENLQTNTRTLLTSIDFTTPAPQRKDLLYHNKWVAQAA